jgi:hypothetical protein
MDASAAASLPVQQPLVALQAGLDGRIRGCIVTLTPAAAVSSPTADKKKEKIGSRLT